MRLTILCLVLIASLEASPIAGNPSHHNAKNGVPASGTATGGGSPERAFALTLQRHPAVQILQADTSALEPVPEPSTWLMLTAGMLLMGMSVLRNRRAGGPQTAGAKPMGKPVRER